MNKKTGVTAIILSALFFLTACSPTGTEGVSTNPPSAEPEVTVEAPEETSYSFGDIVEYDDGLTFTVVGPSEFESSYTPVNTAAYFNVTVTNNGTSEFQIMSDESVTSGGEESEFIADSYNGMEGSPESILKPGETVSWKSAYDIKDLTDVTLLITIDYGNRDALEFKN